MRRMRYIHRALGFTLMLIAMLALIAMPAWADSSGAHVHHGHGTGHWHHHHRSQWGIGIGLASALVPAMTTTATERPGIPIRC